MRRQHHRHLRTLHSLAGSRVIVLTGWSTAVQVFLIFHTLPCCRLTRAYSLYACSSTIMPHFSTFSSKFPLNATLHKYFVIRPPSPLQLLWASSALNIVTTTSENRPQMPVQQRSLGLLVWQIKDVLRGWSASWQETVDSRPLKVFNTEAHLMFSQKASHLKKKKSCLKNGWM